MQALQNSVSVHVLKRAPSTISAPSEHVKCVNNLVCKNRFANFNARTCTLVRSALQVLPCKLTFLKDTYLYLHWIVVADLAVAGRNRIQAAKAIQGLARYLERFCRLYRALWYSGYTAINPTNSSLKTDSHTFRLNL